MVSLLENPGAYAIAASIAMFGGALGTAWAQASIGSSIMGVIAERPEDTFKLIIYMALPELIVLLGFVVAFLLFGEIGKATAVAAAPVA
ncbi:MAG: ATPase [Candidatus Micrarchaeota archaeon]|nr:ATPase [Candidatus Micrarchaeota archaeon]